MPDKFHKWLDTRERVTVVKRSRPGRPAPHVTFTAKLYRGKPSIQTPGMAFMQNPHGRLTLDEGMGRSRKAGLARQTAIMAARDAKVGTFELYAHTFGMGPHSRGLLSTATLIGSAKGERAAIKLAKSELAIRRQNEMIAVEHMGKRVAFVTRKAGSDGDIKPIVLDGHALTPRLGGRVLTRRLLSTRNGLKWMRWGMDDEGQPSGAEFFAGISKHKGVLYYLFTGPGAVERMVPVYSR